MSILEMTYNEMSTIMIIGLSVVMVITVMIFYIARLIHPDEKQYCPYCGYTAGVNYTFVTLHNGRKVCRYCRRAIFAEDMKV